MNYYINYQLARAHQEELLRQARRRAPAGWIGSVGAGRAEDPRRHPARDRRLRAGLAVGFLSARLLRRRAVNSDVAATTAGLI